MHCHAKPTSLGAVYGCGAWNCPPAWLYVSCAVCCAEGAIPRIRPDNTTTALPGMGSAGCGGSSAHPALRRDRSQVALGGGHYLPVQSTSRHHERRIALPPAALPTGTRRDGGRPHGMAVGTECGKCVGSGMPCRALPAARQREEGGSGTGRAKAGVRPAPPAARSTRMPRRPSARQRARPRRVESMARGPRDPAAGVGWRPLHCILCADSRPDAQSPHTILLKNSMRRVQNAHFRHMFFRHSLHR